MRGKRNFDSDKESLTFEMSLCALWLRLKTGRLHNRLDFLVGLLMEKENETRKINGGVVCGWRDNDNWKYLVCGVDHHETTISFRSYLISPTTK